MTEREARLEQWLNVILDHVDYTRNNCGFTEMVGAVLPVDSIEKARAALALEPERE